MAYCPCTHHTHWLFCLVVRWTKGRSPSIYSSHRSVQFLFSLCLLCHPPNVFDPLGRPQIVLELRKTSTKDAGAVLEALEAVRSNVMKESGLCPAIVVRATSS